MADRVMTHEQITELLDALGEEATYGKGLWAVANKQDEISFKAGMRKVMEELRLRGDMKMNFPFVAIRKEVWEKQLKEWGI